MEVDGVSLTMGGAAVSAIAGVVGALIKAKYGKPVIPPVPPVPQPLKTEIAPDPLNVKSEKKPVFVTVGEFNTRLGKVEQDIKDLRGDIQSSNAAVLAKLEENDRRSEERAQKTHQRLDPFIRELGAVHGKMEIIEKAALSATMGGKK